MLDLTSEEIREKRRNERKQFKLDRARAIAEAAAEAESAFLEGREAALPLIPSGSTWKPTASMASEDTSLPAHSGHDDQEEGDEQEALEDLEHLQLTLQEAFFLSWGLDCLTIVEPVAVGSSSVILTYFVVLMLVCRTHLSLYTKFGVHFRTSMMLRLSCQHIGCPPVSYDSTTPSL